MKYRRLAAVTVFVLPSAVFCADFDRSLSLRGSGLAAELRPADGFARAAWSPESSSLRVAGRDVSFGLAAGPSRAVRTLSGGDVRPVFPMLSMGLGGRSGTRLALMPRAGRASGAMLAVQIPIF
jgi:hypothetical protein